MPGVVEAHHANPVVAGLIPIFGYLYAGDVEEFYSSVPLWALAGGALVFSSYAGSGLFYMLAASLVVTAYFRDIIYASAAAKRHNERHAREKKGNLDSRLRGNAAKEKESSRLTIFSTLALGKEYVGAGIAFCF